LDNFRTSGFVLAGHTEVIAKNGAPSHRQFPSGWRSRTLATVAERISHSHPALIVAGATRIEHHRGTCCDRNAADFFLFRFNCSRSSADTAPIFPVQQASLFLPHIFLATASG
jgi:hypothetical protein